jgi:hypothetical protein
MHVNVANKINMRPKIVSLAILILLVSSAFSSPQWVEIFNGEKYGVVIIFKNDNGKVQQLKLKPNDKGKIKSLLDMSFSINSNGNLLFFNERSIPVEYVDNSGYWPFSQRLVRVKLSRNCIYVLRKNEKYFDKNFQVQPNGYPLCPSIK